MEFWLDERGAGTLEYGLVIGLAAMLVVGILLVFGSDTNTSLENSGNAIDQTSSSGHAAQ